MRQVSVGSQQHRSRLAPLSGTRNMAQWDQDFAFAVVLPLKTRPLMLELHESKGGRRKGRTIARAYIPLADLFPSGKSDCEPHSHNGTSSPASIPRASFMSEVTSGVHTSQASQRSWRMVTINS